MYSRRDLEKLCENCGRKGDKFWRRFRKLALQTVQDSQVLHFAQCFNLIPRYAVPRNSQDELRQKRDGFDTRGWAKWLSGGLEGCGRGAGGFASLKRMIFQLRRISWNLREANCFGKCPWCWKDVTLEYFERFWNMLDAYVSIHTHIMYIYIYYRYIYIIWYMYIYIIYIYILYT